MGIKLRANPKFQQLDGNGDPLVGGKVYTYEPGTTTPKATYTDNAKTATNDNPVILNARGEADIWWDGSYKVVITDANDVPLPSSTDNYGAGEDVAIYSAGNWITNGSFESDTDGDGIPDNWSITEYDATSTVELDDTTQEHGEVSLKFVSTGLGGGIAETSFFEVGKSETLYLTFKYKSSVVGVRNVAEISWYTAAQSLISTTTLLDDSTTNPTSFTKQTYQPVVPATGAYAKFKFYGCHSSDATAGTTWLDDVYLNWYPIIDEDTMVSDSVNFAPTQQSVKAYVGTEIGAETAARVAVQGEFTGHASASLLFSNIPFTISTSVTKNVWETIGPTGSGMTNIWTALDDVPTDVDWIEVTCRQGASCNADTAGVVRSADTFARKYLSSELAGGPNYLSYIQAKTDTAGDAADGNFSTGKIAVSSRRFELTWVSNFNNGDLIIIYLVGYGYN